MSQKGKSSANTHHWQSTKIHYPQDVQIPIQIAECRAE